MSKQIEVEYIGKLDKEKFNELKSLLENKGKLKGEKERISFMYFRDKIPDNIEEIKDEKVDLRFRVTNKKPEIVLKYGTFNASYSRKEISIPIKTEDCEKYIEFLSCLGWNAGVIYATKTIIYDYNGIEFSLVEIKDYGYNFEAEILAEKTEIDKAKRIIEEELERLGLKPFRKDELNKQCNTINNRANLQFNFLEQTFNETKRRFYEFFENK